MHKKKILQSGIEAAISAFRISRYICPICGIGLEEDHPHVNLSVEHVPPKSVGGKGIILTCKRCNSTAGHTIDSELAKQQKVEKFFQFLEGGAPDEALFAKLSFGDYSLNVTLSNESNCKKIKILPNVNNPQTVENLGLAFKSMSQRAPLPNFSFNLTSRDRVHFRKASISILRASYLLAVAQFGYKYAFSQELKYIREQIMRPDEEIISSWSMKNSDDSRRPFIGVDFRQGTVVVNYGKESVLLPWPLDKNYGYKSVIEKIENSEKIFFDLKTIPFPKYFVAALDFNDAVLVNAS